MPAEISKVFSKEELIVLTERFGEPRYAFRLGRHLIAYAWLAILLSALVAGPVGILLIIALGGPVFLLSVHLDRRLQLKRYLQAKVNQSESSYPTPQTALTGVNNLSIPDSRSRDNSHCENKMPKGLSAKRSSTKTENNDSYHIFSNKLELDARTRIGNALNSAIDKDALYALSLGLSSSFSTYHCDGIENDADEIASSRLKIILEFCIETAFEIIKVYSSELEKRKYDTKDIHDYMTNCPLTLDNLYLIIYIHAIVLDSDYAEVIAMAEKVIIEFIEKKLAEAVSTGEVFLMEEGIYITPVNHGDESPEDNTRRDSKDQNNSEELLACGLSEDELNALIEEVSIEESETEAGDEVETRKNADNEVIASSIPMLQSQEFIRSDKAVLIRMGKNYRIDMLADDLYEACRGNWAISLSRAKAAKYAYVLYKGIVIEVYTISKWRETDQIAGNGSPRIRFTGLPALERRQLIGSDFSSMFKPGESSPVKYLNC